MKSMKKLQVAVAVTALFAATGSMAASISQSGLTIAREVIAANTAVAQTLKAPSVSYNFDNGPTANALSSQDFNVTLTLGGGVEWGAAVPTYQSIAAVRRNNGNLVVPVVGATYPLGGGSFVYLRLMGVDDVSATTKRFRFRLENETAASVSLGDLQISFNSVNPGNGANAPYVLVTDATNFALNAVGANQPLSGAALAAAVNGQVTKLAAAANASPATSGTAAGATGSVVEGCGEAQRAVTITARNYIGSGAGVEGESAGATTGIVNNGYIVFGTALNVKVEKGVAIDRATDPTTNNTKLTTVPAGTTQTTMALGAVKFSNVAAFDAWDTSTSGVYYKFAAGNDFTAGASTAGHVDISQAAPSASVNGALRLVVTASNGFATGTTFALSNTPFCNTQAAAGPNPIGVVTPATYSNISGNTATLGFSSADLISLVTGGAGGTVIAPQNAAYTNTTTFGAQAAAAANNGVYVCMTVPGSASIPQSSFSAVATLGKDDATEQNNFSCSAPLAGLGGGVKIDVRNFFPYTSDSQEWISVLRVINNSETVAADLTGQYIRADGKYGKWGSLGSLPARGAVYFTSKEINTLLNQNTTTAGADFTDNTGAGGTVGAAGKLAPNTRVRISSNAASTLRVQNYMFNTSTLQLVEVSASQGADFVNLEASGRDHIDQDAQTGIKK